MNIIPIRVTGATRFSCGSRSSKTICSQLMFKLFHISYWSHYSIQEISLSTSSSCILNKSQQAISIFTDCYLVFCSYSKPPCHGTITRLTLHHIQHQQLWSWHITSHPTPPQHNIMHFTHPQRAYYTCNASNQVPKGNVSTILHYQ